MHDHRPSASRRRARFWRDARIYWIAPGLAVALVTGSARSLAAQAAGVIAAPPRPPAVVPVKPVAVVDDGSARARRDSLALTQRLGIDAWVDSAAKALAAGAPATTTPMPPAPPAPTASPTRPDSAAPAARTPPRSRHPTPVRPRRPALVTVWSGRAAWAVAAVGAELYLRPCLCFGAPLPPRLL